MNGEAMMEKRSVFDGMAKEMVRQWDKVCSDGGRGGIIQPKWTGGLVGEGGRAVDADYSDFDAVETAIGASGTGRSRTYFRLTAKYGEAFMNSRAQTTAQHREDWRRLIQQLVLQIRADEQRVVEMRRMSA